MNVKKQTKDPGSSENIQQDKFPKKKDTKGYHFQTTENQRQRKIPERNQRENILSTEEQR